MTSKKLDFTRESRVCKEVCNSCVTLARGQREERKRKAFLRADVVDNAIAELETHGYARLAAPEPNETKGRPLCPLLELHPDLLVKEDE